MVCSNCFKMIYSQFIKCPECGFIDQTLDIPISSIDFSETHIRSGVELFGFSIEAEEDGYFCLPKGDGVPFYLRILSMNNAIEDTRNNPYGKTIKLFSVQDLNDQAINDPIAFYEAISISNLRNPWVSCACNSDLETVLIYQMFHLGASLTMRDFIVSMEKFYVGMDLAFTVLEEYLAD